MEASKAAPPAAPSATPAKPAVRLAVAPVSSVTAQKRCAAFVVVRVAVGSSGRLGKSVQIAGEGRVALEGVADRCKQGVGVDSRGSGTTGADAEGERAVFARSGPQFRHLVGGGDGYLVSLVVNVREGSGRRVEAETLLNEGCEGVPRRSRLGEEEEGAGNGVV